MSKLRLFAVLLAAVLLILAIVCSALYDLNRGQTPSQWAASTTAPSQ